MELVFEQACQHDIPELIRMRIAYLVCDCGLGAEGNKEKIESKLKDYFARKLGKELIAFTAKDGDRIVSVVYLHIIEMPASTFVLNGFYGRILSVYTEPEYRGKGLCTSLMKQMVAYAKEEGINRLDLGATEAGYPIYKKVGFSDKTSPYKDMRLVIED